MKTLKITFVFLLLVLLLARSTSPALAMESRSGDKVVIAKGEVVYDDLYIGANIFILEGTVKGDVVAFGSLVKIEAGGVVEGDLLAAGQGVVINGTVKDDARIAGAVLQLGETAVIGSDLMSAGFSLEISPDASIGGDLVFAGGQALMAGVVEGKVNVAVGGFQLDGEVGGDVDAEVGEPQTDIPFSPMMFMPSTPGIPPVPSVPSGFTLGAEAEIGGSLTYTANKDIEIPAGAVGGTVTRKPQPVATPSTEVVKTITPGKQVLNWFLRLLRNLTTLLVIGLLVAWLAPNLLRKGVEALKAKPWHSLLWGVVAYAAMLFALIAIIFVVVLLAVALGMVTLGDLVGTVISLGLLSSGGLTLGFKIAASYLSKLVVCALVGGLILTWLKSSAAEHRFWPLVIGIVLFALLASIPFIGWLVNVVVILLGLGALWMLGTEWLTQRRAVAVV